MTKIYTTFDNNFQTWNAVSGVSNVLFFGDINGLEQWLVDNADKYTEV